MGTSIIHVKRVNNWTWRLQKLGLYIDGEYTVNVGAGKTETFLVEGDTKHLVQMGYKAKAYTKDQFEIYFESGKEYYFDFGLYNGGDGFNLFYNGTEGWDPDSFSPLQKGINKIKKLI